MQGITNFSLHIEFALKFIFRDIEEDERRRVLVSRLEMRQITETMQMLHAELKRQEREISTRLGAELKQQEELISARLGSMDEHFNAKLDEMLKVKKQRPAKPIKTELKSMVLPPSIPQSHTGGTASVSEVQL